MFIGFKDKHGARIINTDKIESLIDARNLMNDTYGIDVTMTSGELLELEWEKENERDKMMSYLYGQLVQPGLKTIEPNRFFDATED